MQRFNSDTSALRHRADLNARHSLHDLDAWIVDKVSPRPGMSVLDLGCGTGKQLFALAPLIGSSGLMVGVDIASAAIEEVNERSRREGVGHVSAVQAALDEVPSRFAGSTFDLILSTYAIYYSADAVGLLGDLRPLIAAEGTVFVSGPGEGTNQEINQLVNGLLPDGVPPLDPVLDFVDSSGLARLGGAYREVVTHRLPNEVRFASPEEVLRWWRNHNSYRPEADEPLVMALDRHFSRSPAFVLTKSVLGVHLRA